MAGKKKSRSRPYQLLLAERDDLSRRERDGRSDSMVVPVGSNVSTLHGETPCSAGYQIRRCGGLSDDDRDRIVEESYQ